MTISLTNREMRPAGFTALLPVNLIPDRSRGLWWFAAYVTKMGIEPTFPGAPSCANPQECSCFIPVILHGAKCDTMALWQTKENNPNHTCHSAGTTSASLGLDGLWNKIQMGLVAYEKAERKQCLKSCRQYRQKPCRNNSPSAGVCRLEAHPLLPWFFWSLGFF